jgi:septum formation topological specificity factor MinE
MTVKELIAILNEYVETDPTYLDLQVQMVGHNDYGIRDYEIPVEDVTANREKGRLTLWDF